MDRDPLASLGLDAQTMAQLRELFAEEANDHLEALVAALNRAAGTAPEARGALADMLRTTHTLKGAASTVGLALLGEGAHLLEEYVVHLRDAGGELDARALDALGAALEVLRSMVASTRTGVAMDGLLAELRAHLTCSAGDLSRRTGEPPAREELVAGRKAAEGPTRLPEETLRIRIDVTRLDKLMDAIGELVIQRTRLEQRIAAFTELGRDLAASRRSLHAALSERVGAAASRLPELDIDLAHVLVHLERTTALLLEDSETLRRTTHSLQGQLGQIRMMPIRWLHARLQRPVHELARSAGKRVELLTGDEAVELDRLVIEQITDPLIHLIRNAIAHGIETPEERQRAGKPPAGVVRVNARHQGDLLFVEVEDDGAGMDLQRLRATLMERAQLSPEQVKALSDSEVLAAIARQGFTTRQHADQLAGRGVGLDVVYRNILGAGGSIQVSSTPGHGSRFTIQLPIATAIVQALLFKVGEPVYAIPVAYVEEVLEAGPEDLTSPGEPPRVRCRRDWVPLLCLHEVLGEEPPSLLARGDGLARPAGRQPVVVLRYGERSFGVTCTRVVGPREIVLKQLGPLLARLPLFSAVTISGSNKVQFVLDVAVLARLAAGQSMSCPSVARSTGGRTARILVVDDSRAVRVAVARLLGAAGYAVDLAADGWEAWQQLQRLPYDLLLTDLEMPRVHGYELIARCREHAELGRLPILVLTSRQCGELPREQGANGVLAKPVDRRALLQGIRELLG